MANKPFKNKKEDTYSFRSIGIVESCFSCKFGTPRQSGLVKEALAKIKIYPSFQPEESLQGLENFSHLWVLFLFHQNKDRRFHAKVHPPRLSGLKMGVFATRSPHRPNPVGLSLVELVKIEEKSIFVRGVDMISGTPVLDIKPYLPDVESPSQTKQGWAAEISTKEIQVEWTQESLFKLREWEARSQKTHLLALIESTLKLDPRPTVYKTIGHGPIQGLHAIRFYEADVHFTFLTPEKIQVVKVIV